MIMFIIYSLILFISSNGIGKLIIDKNSKLYEIRSIIGFMILLSVLQTIYFPIEYKFMSFNVGFILTLIIIITSFIIGLFKISLSDFNFLKSYEFYVIFILIFLILKILPANEAGDDIFYMALIKDNAYLQNINSINPRTGEIGKISNIYWYQGYYLLVSFLYKIQNIISYNINNILLVFRSTFSLFFAIFSSYIFVYAKKHYLNKIPKWTKYFIQIVALLLIGAQEWSHIYWGSFSLFQVFIPTYLIIFENYIQKKENKKVLLLFFSTIATISLASSSLFLIGIIIFGFLTYEVLFSKVKIQDYFIISSPLILYILLLFKIEKYAYILLIVFFAIEFSKKYVNKVFNKYLKFIPFLIPCILIFINFVYIKNYNWNLYRLGYLILLFNLVVSIFVISVTIHTKKINPNLFVFITTVLVFFNPLTASVVAKYLTTDAVYYRLFYITKNPLIICIIFSFTFDFIKNKHFLLNMFNLFLIILSTKYIKNIANFTFLEPTYNQKYNFILREVYDNIEMGEFIEPINSKKFLSIYFAPRIFNNNLYSIVYRYPNDKNLKDELYLSILYYDGNNMEEFKEKIKEDEIDYIIIFNKEEIKNKLNFLEKIYENKTYIFYKVSGETSKN